MTIEEYKRQKIEEYYKTLSVRENVETRRLSKNTVCELTHMTSEEYQNKKLILENQKYLNEKLAQKEIYTVEEARAIIKDVLKKFYDSLS